MVAVLDVACSAVRLMMSSRRASVGAPSEGNAQNGSTASPLTRVSQRRRHRAMSVQQAKQHTRIVSRPTDEARSQRLGTLWSKLVVAQIKLQSRASMQVLVSKRKAREDAALTREACGAKTAAECWQACTLSGSLASLGRGSDAHGRSLAISRQRQSSESGSAVTSARATGLRGTCCGATPSWREASAGAGTCAPCTARGNARATHTERARQPRRVGVSASVSAEAATDRDTVCAVSSAVTWPIWVQRGRDGRGYTTSILDTWDLCSYTK